MVDVVDSKSTAGDSVPVRVRSPAPNKKERLSPLLFIWYRGADSNQSQMQGSGGALLPPVQTLVALFSAKQKMQIESGHSKLSSFTQAFASLLFFNLSVFLLVALDVFPDQHQNVSVNRAALIIRNHMKLLQQFLINAYRDMFWHHFHPIMNLLCIYIRFIMWYDVVNGFIVNP